MGNQRLQALLHFVESPGQRAYLVRGLHRDRRTAQIARRKLLRALLQIDNWIRDTARELEAKERDENQAHDDRSRVRVPHTDQRRVNEIVRHRESENPARRGNRAIREDVRPIFGFVREEAFLVLHHLVEARPDVRNRLEIRHLLMVAAGGQYLARRLDDNADALFLVLDFLRLLRHHVEADVRAERAAESTVHFEGRHRRNDQLVRVLVHIRLGENRLARLFRVRVPRARARVEAARAVAGLQRREIAVLHADVEVEYLLVIRHRRQRVDGLDFRHVAVEARHQARRVGRRSLLLAEPPFQFLGLRAHRVVDFPLDARVEVCACRVVADDGNDRQEQAHHAGKREKLLLDAHNTISPLKNDMTLCLYWRTMSNFGYYTVYKGGYAT